MVLAVGTLTAGLAAGAPVASAQQQGTDIGGTVPPGFVELVLAQPKSTFATFSAAKTYTTSFDVAVTTTEPKAQLSLADGEVTKGTKIGRLASGSKLLKSPLEARVGSTAFAPLDSSLDALLTRWTTIQANGKVRVDLRQKVDAKTSGNYRKVLLVTLSTDTP